MTTFLSLLTVLADIKMIGDYIDTFARAVFIWYISRQKQNTLSAIIDAASFQMRAESDEDRYKSSEMWHRALSRPRY